MNQARLERLFERYNKQFFGGRLPHYKIDTTGKYAGGRCDRGKRIIYIEPGMRRNTQQVLIHEMAHAAARDRNHGPVWIREMDRLRKRGAPILQSEIDMYREGQMIQHSDILQQITDAARENLTVPVNELVQDICYDYGITTNEGIAESAFAKRFVAKARRLARLNRQEGIEDRKGMSAVQISGGSQL